MQLGTKLGHYEIGTLLGKGGMGEVWRARDTKLGREVAIKTLPEEFARDTDRLVRFEREAKLLASLNHPNIAAIYGLEEFNGTRFLVLELVDGDTLADQIKRGPIGVEDSLKLALQIAEALEAAHEKGVIHRDLKPANIKVTHDHKVKVLDFGLAKAFDGDGPDASLSNSPTLSMAATQQGVILGTAAYMSPEQASGEATDKRTDVWAFGVVLFEMLTGRQVFTGKNVSRILAAVLNNEPEWVSLPSNLHPRLRLLLEGCLEKEATDRLSGISDARVHIQKVLADPSGVLVQPVAEVIHAPPQSKLPWVAAILLALFVGGAIVWTLRPASELGLVSRFSQLLPEDQQFTRPDRTVVALSPDGSRMVYVANRGLHLRAMDTLESNPIPGTDDDAVSPFFSSDGQWIGYYSFADRQLKKIAVSGGAPVTLYDATNSFGTPRWGNDGNIVWGQSEGLWRVSENGGTPELLIASEGVVLRDPQILPGGSSVLFVLGGLENGEVTLQSLEGGERKVLFPGIHPTYVSTGHIIYGLEDALFAVPFDLDTLEVIGGPVPLIEGVRARPSQYAVSDSGTLVYVPGTGTVAGANAVLTWVDRDGNRERLPLPPRPYRQPQLSPDGTRLAVQTTDADGEGDIWVYDLDGSTQMRQMTGEGNNGSPIWTPDGERITFTSDRDGQQRIYWQQADLSGVAEPLTPPEQGVRQIPDSWTPDGRTLSITRFDGTSSVAWSVWILSLDEGGEPEFFVTATEEDGNGSLGSAFSPDGQWLVYRTGRAPNEQLYMQPFPATGTEFRVTQRRGSLPIWSADGDELFYRRGGAAGNQQAEEFAAVDINLEGTPDWTNERVLPIEGFLRFTGSRDYDITPDGERFIMVFPADQADSSEPARPQINIVLNWFEELKERVPVP